MASSGMRSTAGSPTNDSPRSLRRYEGIEPEELLFPALPDTPVTFEPDKDYVREMLATPIDLRADGLQAAP